VLALSNTNRCVADIGGTVPRSCRRPLGGRGEMARVTIVAVLALVALSAKPRAATLLTFDELPHASPLSTEYSSLGVVFSSTAPIGASVSSDPADSLLPGEAVAPFVFAIVAVPSTSTPSFPNKVIAAKFDAGGSLIQCERCGIRISFLDPIPTEVGFFITDPDGGQSAHFFGTGGPLGSVAIAPASSALPEFVTFSHLGGISEVVLVSAPSVGIGIDSLEFSAAVPEPASGAALGVVVAGCAALHRLRRPTSRCS
jgi:hypothetical protein